MKRLTVGLILCFLLIASKASATYVVVENISPTAPLWGGCACYPATGWLGAMVMDLTVDGESFTIASGDSPDQE